MCVCVCLTVPTHPPQYAKSCLQHDTTMSGALTWRGFVAVYDHFVEVETKQVSSCPLHCLASVWLLS